MLRFVPRSTAAFTRQQQAKLRPYTGVVASLLFARGIQTAEEAEQFLHPELSQLHDPFRLSDMQKAVDLIGEAKAGGWQTVVYGDYDTDGICAASLLTQALRAYGVNATPYLPLRDDGYGLHADAVEELAKTYQLLITVDLGITNIAEVALARQLGIRVIVTDHHQLGLAPCPADAVINPLLGDYPFASLCGAGVALKLATALHGADADLVGALLPLAAVATIADIVSLTGENRVIAALGLPLIPNNLGLKALMDAADVKAPVSEGTVGYQLAPRLNAAGRVGDANAAVRLLLTGDSQEAAVIARQLDEANNHRKRLETAALKEALLQAETHDFVRRHVLFVRGEGWHKGVIGLTAGKLNRQYAVPVCALSEAEGLLHGSLRGVPGVDLSACLKQCDDLLIKYGGHERAAGVTLDVQQYPAFMKRLEAAVTQSAAPDSFVPVQPYDLELSLSDADDALVDTLSRLRPFGIDHPAPVFYTGGATLESRRAVGAGGAHLQLRLRQNRAVLPGIAFGMGGEAAALPEEIDVAYTLERNEFRGRTTVQCHVSALRPGVYARQRLFAMENTAPYQDALIDRLVELAGKPNAGAENYQPVPVGAEGTEGLPQPGADDLLDGHQGTLYIAYTQDSAAGLLSRLGDQVDVAVGTVDDPRCFHTLLVRPAVAARIAPHWKHVVLLDGALSPADAACWAAQCETARLLVPAQTPALRAAIAALDAGDDAYRALYRLLRRSAFASLDECARAAGLPRAQTLAGLTAFAQLQLIRLERSPFAYAVLPAAKCELADSPLLHYIRSAGKER